MVSLSTLYTASKGTKLSQFDMPPVPPEGIFDVRFSSQRSVEIIGSDSKQIVITGAEYPVSDPHRRSRNPYYGQSHKW